MKVFKIENKAGKIRTFVAKDEDSCRDLCKELNFVTRTKHLKVVDITKDVLDGTYFNGYETEIYNKHLDSMPEGMVSVAYDNTDTVLRVWDNYDKKFCDFTK